MGTEYVAARMERAASVFQPCGVLHLTPATDSAKSMVEARTRTDSQLRMNPV